MRWMSLIVSGKRGSGTFVCCSGSRSSQIVIQLGFTFHHCTDPANTQHIHTNSTLFNMVDRSHKPTAISASSSGPQAQVDVNNTTVTAKLPSGESIEVYLYGATITSWNSHGKEQLFLSDKAVTDGSKPIRGGVPVVFPVRPHRSYSLCHQRAYIGERRTSGPPRRTTPHPSSPNTASHVHPSGSS